MAAQRPVVLGMGRPEAADDGAGPLLVRLLVGRTSAVLYNAATAPENFVGPVAAARPDVVLLVDAVHFNAPVGSVRLFRPGELEETDFTTHGMSPELFLNFLTARTGAVCLVLGIQPGTLGSETEMSAPVRLAVQTVAGALARLFPPAV